jgi:hypothetical protein
MSMTSTQVTTMTAKIPARSLRNEAGGRPEPLRRGRPPKGKNVPKHDQRLQIKLTDEGRERLDMLVARVGAAGIAEVVRDALRIYDIITEQVIEKENQFLLRQNVNGEVMRATFWEKSGQLSM